jgi:hypothetical protein
MSKVTPSTHKTRQDTRNEILDTVLESVLEAVKTARELLHHDDPNVRLRAIHGVSQSALSAQRVYESTDLLRRLERLEAFDAEYTLPHLQRN